MARRTLSRLALVSLVAASMAAAGAAFAQAVSFVAGTGVGLAPPRGMVASKSFAGFEHAESGASILVTELPAEAYPQILASFTPDGLAASGLQAAGPAADLRVAGGEGARVIRGKQTAHGTVFRKWVVLAKGPASTAMLSIQVPDAKAAALPDAAVEASLRTVTLKAPPGLEEQISALPFRLGDRVGFRPVRIIAGSGLLLTDGARDVLPDASQPVVIIASALGAVPADKAGREALAKQAFASIEGVSDAIVVSQKVEEKDGVLWSRIEGRGTYRASMEAISTIQLMRFDKGGYVRVIGIVRSLDGERILPRVDALAESITPK